MRERERDRVEVAGVHSKLIIGTDRKRKRAEARQGHEGAGEKRRGQKQ